MRNRLHHISLTEKNRTKMSDSKKLQRLKEIRRNVTTTHGDRLDLLANQFYNDVKLWWIIATANRNIIRKDSYSLKPGLEIRIPFNINKILSDFEQINKK